MRTGRKITSHMAGDLPHEYQMGYRTFIGGPSHGRSRMLRKVGAGVIHYKVIRADSSVGVARGNVTFGVFFVQP